MAGEYFRAVKPVVFLGVPRAALDELFGPAALAEIGNLLDANTVPEPLTVALRDQGYNDDSAGTTPPTVALDVVQFQLDAGLNEIPRATVRLASGRSGGALAAGSTDLNATSIVHFLERYLGTSRLPAKLYCKTTVTAAAGLGDVTDNLPVQPEWVALFDGTVVALARRGSPESMAVVATLTHFADALTFSSSLTGRVAAGANVPLAMSIGRFSARTAGGVGNAVTPYGAAAQSIAGGVGLYTDFWGFSIPGSADTQIPASAGLKQWLVGLSGEDVFAWENLGRADLGSSACVYAGPRKNDKAAAALNRIEPKWPAWDATAANAAWAPIRSAVHAAIAANPAAGGVDRGTLLADAAANTGYYAAGYRYGVPVAFQIDNSALQPLSSGVSFAKDVVAATWNDLAGNSFWQLLVGRYAANYQVAFVPMADRALVVPFQPLSDGVWQHVAASEIASWEDSIGNPVPVRGVVLVGGNPSASGGFSDGNQASAPGAQAAYQQLSAGYDSCDDGVFEFREMPPWLINLYRPAPAYSQYTLSPIGRALAAVPWAGLDPSTGLTHAARAVDAVIGMIDAPSLAAAYALSGIIRQAAKAPPAWATSAASRMALALWQQARTQHNTYYATTRFRWDVGVGSTVLADLPVDKWVGAASADVRDTTVKGMVVRVSLTMNKETEEAATHLQLGYVRTETQFAGDSKLFANSHPFWGTSFYGAPWADSVAIRARLGDGSSIAPSILNPS